MYPKRWSLATKNGTPILNMGYHYSQNNSYIFCIDWPCPRHTFTSRWIFTGISSHLYYKDWTIDDLLGEFSKQAIDAFETGICDPWLGAQYLFETGIWTWVTLTNPLKLFGSVIPKLQPAPPPRTSTAPDCAWCALAQRAIGPSFEKTLGWVPCSERPDALDWSFHRWFTQTYVC